ncbi:hypothetical protein KSS87_005230 [Heliosperma pusillum]|nr:hypothetical protein KSS87_005230 [Heliosperma pusillum]
MAASSATAIDRPETSLQEELALPILLADRVIKAAAEAESSRVECAEIARQTDALSHKLRAAVRLTSFPAVYDRPIRRIAAETSKNLERALTLVRKCKHSGIFRHVFLTITSSIADFKKVSNVLESSIADVTWLLSTYAVNDDDDDDDNGGSVALPPIAINDSIIAWIWSYIASLQSNRRLNDRIDAANNLASLAKSNFRYRKVIVEENAVSPLLRLLKDGGGCAEGQVAAAMALCWLAENDEERCRAISCDKTLGIPVIVQVLGESSMSVQIAVADLVAKIAEADKVAREDFGRENVLKPLVSCLVYDSDMDEYRRYHSGGSSRGSYHMMSSSTSMGGASHTNSKKDRENESTEVKHKLKVKCALALWRLCENSVLNSQKIAEPKGLFCLSKIIETEEGELRLNCLMTIMEVARVAEGNAEFRKAAWKPTSPPTKAVLDQLRKVVKEESNPDFLIPAIKSIGCLARIFSAKESGLVSSLVGKLGDGNVSVAIEAAIALTKFACPDDHNCVDHSKTIIECNGIPLLMKLLGTSDRAKRDGLVLLCYLSMNVGNSKALVEAKALRTLESAVHSGMVQNADLREIIARAMNNLMLYQDGPRAHIHSFDMNRLFDCLFDDDLRLSRMVNDTIKGLVVRDLLLEQLSRLPHVPSVPFQTSPITKVPDEVCTLKEASPAEAIKVIRKMLVHPHYVAEMKRRRRQPWKPPSPKPNEFHHQFTPPGKDQPSPPPPY